MLPHLVGTLGAIYSAGKAVDNFRYWRDYEKNTGYRPKYPFRSGSMDYVGYSIGSGVSYRKLKRL